MKSSASTLTYAERLKHPQWQKKRLQVFQRAEFHCEVCDSGDKTLHAHHKRYINGRLPWEYDLSDLMCACESCHKSLSAAQSVLAGQHDSEAVRDAFQSFLRTFAEVSSQNDHSPEDIVAMLEFLSSCCHLLDYPSRWEFGLETKKLKEMSAFIEKMILNAYSGAAKEGAR